MSTPDTGHITQLLRAHRRGDVHALSHVYDAVYAHLQAAARAQLRRDARARAGVHTLSTTALVHEAFLKLRHDAEWTVHDYRHFMAMASRAMRQVLVEYARKHRAKKRGAGIVPLELDDAQVAIDERADSLLALDEALTRLHGNADSAKVHRDWVLSATKGR